MTMLFFLTLMLISLSPERSKKDILGVLNKKNQHKIYNKKTKNQLEIIKFVKEEAQFANNTKDRSDVEEYKFESFNIEEVSIDPESKTDQFYQKLFKERYPQESSIKKYKVSYKDREAYFLKAQQNYYPMYLNTLDSVEYLNKGQLRESGFRFKKVRSLGGEKTLWKFHIAVPPHIETKEGQQEAGRIIALVESVLNQDRFNGSSYKIMVALETIEKNPGKLIAIYGEKKSNWHEMIQELIKVIEKYKMFLSPFDKWQVPVSDRPFHPIIYGRQHEKRDQDSYVGSYRNEREYGGNYEWDNTPVQDYDTVEFIDKTYGSVYWSHEKRVFVFKNKEEENVIYNPIFKCDDEVFNEDILRYFFEGSKESSQSLSLRLRCIKWSLTPSEEENFLSEKGSLSQIESKLEKRHQQWNKEKIDFFCQQIGSFDEKIDKNEKEKLKSLIHSLLEGLRGLVTNEDFLNILNINNIWWEITEIIKKVGDDKKYKKIRNLESYQSLSRLVKRYLAYEQYRFLIKKNQEQKKESQGDDLQEKNIILSEQKESPSLFKKNQLRVWYMSKKVKIYS